MKGLFFAKPVEYRLETAAETLTQGDTFGGQLVATNRGAEPVSGQALRVALAFAEFKQLKADPANAFEILEPQTLLEDQTLPPDGGAEAPWTIALSPECAITSKSSSLFLLYGNAFDDPAQYGMLDLRVALAAPLETFIATVENHFSFVAGSRKHAGGYTEVKFKPPRTYPTLDSLTIQMRLTAEQMELVLNAKLKTVGRGQSGGVNAKAVKIEKTYPRDQVVLGPNLPNRNLFKHEFEQVLEELVPNFVQK